MRQLMMTVMALAALGAMVATAQAENQTARPSQAVSADTVYCPIIFGVNRFPPRTI